MKDFTYYPFPIIHDSLRDVFRFLNFAALREVEDADEAFACASLIAPLLKQKSMCSFSPRLSVCMVFEQIGHVSSFKVSVTEGERDRLRPDGGFVELEGLEVEA